MPKIKYRLSLTPDEREELKAVVVRGKLGHPPAEDATFVAHMEMVLDVYRRPYDCQFPVVCMDESPRQLIDEVKMPIPGAPGRPARYDYEYKRHGGGD